MRNVRIVFIQILNFFLGYLAVPSSVLGFMLLTNSLKGWNVQNEDGAVFIPFGVIILLLFAAIVIVNIFKIIAFVKGKTANIFFCKYVKSIAYFFGVFIYLLQIVVRLFIKVDAICIFMDLP